MRFAGQTVVITGGAGGIGRAAAAGFAEAGANVALLDVAGAEAAADLLAAEYPNSIVCGVEVSVTHAQAVTAAFNQLADQLGGPHVLVTLAGGSMGTPRDLPDILPVDLDTVLDVNVNGTFYCCQAVAPLMAAVGGGAIVTCSSLGARHPSPVTGVPYATAKAAIGGLTRRLARELGPSNIRVNAVAPGLVLTERLQRRFDAMTEAERREVLDAIPLGRMPELREIVEPIVFLASEAASFITGITLDINGGRYVPA